MSRLVEARRGVARADVARDPNQGVKDYLERVAKYVPGEILAAYLIATPILLATTDAASTQRFVLQAVAFLGMLVLTPLYFRFMASPGEPRRLHMAVSTVGFAVWAYSQGALFDTLNWSHAGVSALALIFFSLVSGLLVPKEGSA